MRTLFILLLITILLDSCSPKIYYLTSDISSSNVSDLKQYTVSIDISNDLRKEFSPYKKWIFSERYNNKVECYNCEKDYYGITVPFEIEKCIVEHVKAKKYFRNVFFGKSDTVDFSVYLQLKSFAANTSINPKAITEIKQNTILGAMGGIVAASSIGKMKSELSYTIDYSGIIIHDNDKNLNLPVFQMASSGKSKIPAITDCHQIYKHLNTILKSHNEKFAELIAEKIREYVISGINSEVDELVE